MSTIRTKRQRRMRQGVTVWSVSGFLLGRKQNLEQELALRDRLAADTKEQAK